MIHHSTCYITSPLSASRRGTPAFRRASRVVFPAPTWTLLSALSIRSRFANQRRTRLISRMATRLAPLRVTLQLREVTLQVPPQKYPTYPLPRFQHDEAHPTPRPQRGYRPQHPQQRPHPCPQPRPRPPFVFASRSVASQSLPAPRISPRRVLGAFALHPARQSPRRAVRRGAAPPPRRTLWRRRRERRLRTLFSDCESCRFPISIAKGSQTPGTPAAP
mmetsp:Transcript_8224/g.30753  ORF Transcript_8224/g.30753 Transcript_8224/m.30753 type:complete len:219 (-) Transcript_8224:2029-2685(-)